MRLLKLALFLAVLFFVGRELAGPIREMDWSRLRPHWGFLAGTVLLRLGQAALGGQTRYMLLRAIHKPPPRLVVYASLWLSDIGRYLPGKMAAVAGAVWLLARRGVPPRATAAMVFLRQGLAVVLGLVVSVPLTLWEPVRRHLPLAWLWCAGVIAAGVICLHPAVFLGLANGVLRRLRQPPLPGRWRGRHYLLPLCCMAANIAAGGLSMWLLARTICDVSLAWFPVLVSGGCLAGVAGFLAVFAPAGLGVREGILWVVLSQIIPPGEAAVVTLASRAIHILAEFTMAALGAAVLRIAR